MSKLKGCAAKSAVAAALGAAPGMAAIAGTCVVACEPDAPGALPIKSTACGTAVSVLRSKPKSGPADVSVLAKAELVAVQRMREPSIVSLSPQVLIQALLWCPTTGRSFVTAPGIPPNRGTSGVKETTVAIKLTVVEGTWPHSP